MKLRYMAFAAAVMAVGCAHAPLRHEYKVRKEVDASRIGMHEKANHVGNLNYVMREVERNWDNFARQMSMVRVFRLHERPILDKYGGAISSSNGKVVDTIELYQYSPYTFVHETCHIWHANLPPEEKAKFENAWTNTTQVRYRTASEKEIRASGVVRGQGAEGIEQDVAVTCELAFSMLSPDTYVPGISPPEREDGRNRYPTLARRNDPRLHNRMKLLWDYSFISGREYDTIMGELEKP